MAEAQCRYIVNQFLAERCGARATEVHKDTYYKENHPVCKEHKRMLVIAALKKERAANDRR